MFAATELREPHRTYRFRSLDALSRRLGGDGTWQAEHDPAFVAPTRTVTILRYDTKVAASHVITRVRVPAEALADTSRGEDEDDAAGQL